MPLDRRRLKGMAIVPEVPGMDSGSQKMQFLRTVHLGVGFMLLFSADNTRSNVMKLLNLSIHEDDPSYAVDGYVALAITYLVYGFSMTIAPGVITITGPRGAMILGSVMMTTFLYLLTLEETWATYTGIFMSGVGGAFVWVGQGNFLVLNSEPPKHNVHVSLFWAIFTLSTMIGNLYAVFIFAGKTRLDFITRRNLVFAMFGMGLGAVVVFASLRPAKRKTPLATVKETAFEAFKKTVALYMSREFLTLIIPFCFIGFQQSFGWGVHSSCIGFTNSFGSFATELAPISAVIYGAGGTFGGTFHVIAPHLRIYYVRRYVFGIGYAMQILALIGIFLNLPNSSVFGKTDEEPYLKESKVWLACICSFLMGMGDSFYNTQLYPLLASLHPQFSSHTSALYKFTKSLAMAAFYFASIAVGLHYQAILMIVMGFFAVICFSIVDKKICVKENEIIESVKRTERNNYNLDFTVQLNPQYINSVHLGISFYLFYTPDYCLMNIQKLMTKSIKDDDPAYDLDGYIVVAIAFLMTAVSFFIAPSVVSVVGARGSMFIAGLFNTFFVIALSAERLPVTYLGTVLNGIACALLWVGQGNYLVLNSDPDNTARHGSIFWAFYGLSLVSGNVYVSLVFLDKIEIDFETRRNVMMVMVAITAISVFSFGTLRPPLRKAQQPDKIGPLEALRKTFEISMSRNSLYLLLPYLFNGNVITFSFVVPSAIGFTKAVGPKATMMVPLASVMFGSGSVAGSIFSSWIYRYKKSMKILLWIGFLLITFGSIVLSLNIPDSAAFDYTTDKSYIQEPLIWVLLLSNFSVGVADSFYNTHGYRVVAALYPDNSAESTALTRFIRTVSTSTFLFLCPFIGFHTHVCIVITIALLAAINLHILEIKVCRKEKAVEEPKVLAISNLGTMGESQVVV
ncbi:hypothetical protein GE061_010308 [Apolygus lucorum]|uniref:UNC93-like protein MFSD11 n=1 Tax=Apolygus lucorum TaxID=248454 RepID=A0A8S9Y2M7_APOLU|nr:hypothetical protein GE061_010308 [Apolygus lucorum]